MKNLTYFVPTPETAEDLKSMYRKLAMKYHPDRGGDVEVMKAVNSEYDRLFEILKDVHKTKDGEKFTSRQTTSETADSFKDLITELMRMDDIVIEVIGCFVWVTGNTRPYREQLKALGFLWHSKKTAWYLKPLDYKRQSHRDYSFDEIRSMYGSGGKVSSNGTVKIDSESA